MPGMTSPGGSAEAVESVEAAWERIETWLAAHAPVTFDALAPPADPAAIAAAQAAIDPPVPEPLRTSLLRHDGTGYRVLLPPFWRLLSAAEVASQWQLRTEINDRSPWPSDEDGGGGEGGAVDAEAADADYGPWWHRQWIPFAADDCGDYLVLDERPIARRRGRIGDADHEMGCSFPPDAMWASLPVLLEMTATALETGGQVGGCERFVTPEGELDWEIL